MKNFNWIIAIFIIIISAVSCLEEEPVSNVVYNFKSVDSIEIVQIRPAREITEIRAYFTRNNSCEDFFDYNYNISSNDRYVTFVFSKITNASCIPINQITDYTLEFQPERAGTYHFRFWKGLDSEGRDTYIDKEIIIP